MNSVFKASVVAVALAGLALTGCNSPSTEAPADNSTTAADETMTDDATMGAEETVVFECPGGETITAQFMGDEEALVTLPDQDPVALPITEAASGARYSDGTTTLWNKGDEVLVEVDGNVVLSGCVAQN